MSPSRPLAPANRQLMAAAARRRIRLAMVRAHAAHQNVDRAIAHHVAALRARGISWARVGEALGMTRQSAWERFSGED